MEAAGSCHIVGHSLPSRQNIAGQPKHCCQVQRSQQSPVWLYDGPGRWINILQAMQAFVACYSRSFYCCQKCTVSTEA